MQVERFNRSNNTAGIPDALQFASAALQRDKMSRWVLAE